MKEQTVHRSYVGVADKPPSWAELDRLLEALWGPEVSYLPFFPDVLGGVTARWFDADGVEHKASVLDDLRIAYENETTARIVVSGHINHRPRVELEYLPAGKRSPQSRSRPIARAVVSAPDAATADRLVAAVGDVFPHVESTLFISYSGSGGESLANRLKKVLQDRIPAHVRAFVAPRDIAPGDEPPPALRDAMLSSVVTVALCSSDSRHGTWLAWEAAAAWIRSSLLLPVLVDVEADDFGGPIMFWAQAKRGWDKDHLDEALSAAVTAAGGTWTPLNARERDALAEFLVPPRATD